MERYRVDVAVKDVLIAKIQTYLYSVYAYQRAFRVYKILRCLVNYVLLLYVYGFTCGKFQFVFTSNVCPPFNVHHPVCTRGTKNTCVIDDIPVFHIYSRMCRTSARM